MTQRVEPDIFRRDDKAELGITADLYQRGFGKWTGRCIILEFGGAAPDPRQDFPSRVRYRQQNLRPAADLQRGLTRKNHSGGLVQRQIIRTPQGKPNERTHVMCGRNENSAARRYCV